ncbi:site-specific integrase [Serratia symbiotica]|uniref:site-specific integrase n=1 Tax=Serratia symbiotica TaxID=138074 RepID=UPI00132CB0E2|nr:site-specific integrase [Serratia symbiotica]QTP13322.1 site-specific integrase [Serratia symbiotica]
MKPFSQTNLITKIAELDQLSSSTINTYTQKVNVLINHCQKQGKESSIENMTSTLDSLIKDRKITRSTSRIYKAALLNKIVIDASKNIDRGLSIDWHNEMFSLVEALDSKLAPINSQQTSSLKLKKFPDELISKIEKLEREDYRYRNLNFLILFLRANLLVGLRPIEWANASLFTYTGTDSFNKKNSCPALVVGNAKATHGRANGIERDIVFNGISIEELGDIIQFTKLMQSHLNGLNSLERKQRTNDIFKNTQQTLSRVLERINYPKGKRPSLYSTRHQCIANSKSANLSEIEIAALFGHKTSETARVHYGKKRDGSGKVVISPSVESILKVKEQILKQYETNLELKKESDEIAERWLKSKF